MVSATQRVRSWTFLLVAAGALVATGCIQRAESVEGRRRNFDRRGLDDVILQQAPAGLTGGGAEFADGVRFLGHVVEPAVPRAGSRAAVTLYWEATDDPQEDWRVFVHLDPLQGGGRRIIGDHEPAGGRYPTAAWRKGEIVRDRFEVGVPTSHAGGRLELWVGLYQGDRRLDVENAGRVRTDGKDRVRAGVLRVE